MKFPGHPVIRELEALVGHAHSIIYRQKIVRHGNWRRFWSTEYPCLIRESLRPILLATLIFWTGAVLGVGLTLEVPSLAEAFVSPDMKAALQRRELWTQGITAMAPQASSAIAQNNVFVSLVGWALGITFGIGTIYLLIVNGLMLGAIAVVCMRLGMLAALAQFVVAHGMLELPAIWITSGAGLLLAKALVLPGRYTRKVELQLQGRRSVRLAAGTIPILLIAAAVEGFISPNNAISGSVKCGVAVALGLAFLAYVLTLGRHGGRAQTAMGVTKHGFAASSPGTAQ